MSSPRSAEVDAYIETHVGEVHDRLLALRETLHRAVPGALEKISYGVPTLSVAGKNVVHFGGFKAHVSVYPVPTGDEAFAADVVAYRAGRGTLKFPINAPLPLDLVYRQGAFLLAERGVLPEA